MKDEMKSESNDHKGQVIVFVFLILFLLTGSAMSVFYLHRLGTTKSDTAKLIGDADKKPARSYSYNRYYHEVLMY